MIITSLLYQRFQRTIKNNCHFFDITILNKIISQNESILIQLTFTKQKIKHKKVGNLTKQIHITLTF